MMLRIDAPGDVARLVRLAAPDRDVGPGSPADRRGQGPRAIADERAADLRIEPALAQLVQEGPDGCAVLPRPLDDARDGCFRPGRRPRPRRSSAGCRRGAAHRSGSPADRTATGRTTSPRPSPAIAGLAGLPGMRRPPQAPRHPPPAAAPGAPARPSGRTARSSRRPRPREPSTAASGPPRLASAGVDVAVRFTVLLPPDRTPRAYGPTDATPPLIPISTSGATFPHSSQAHPNRITPPQVPFLA